MEYVCYKSQCMLYILIVMICLKNLVVFLFIGYSLQITKTAFRRSGHIKYSQDECCSKQLTRYNTTLQTGYKSL